MVFTWPRHALELQDDLLAALRPVELYQQPHAGPIEVILTEATRQPGEPSRASPETGARSGRSAPTSTPGAWLMRFERIIVLLVGSR